MGHLKLMVLFALVLVGCSEHALIDEGDPLPADAAPVVCVPGKQIACACLNGYQGVQVCNDHGTAFKQCACPGDVVDAGKDGKDAGAPEASTDAQPEATVDAKPESSTGLKTCAVKQTVNLGVADPSFLTTVGAKGFALGLCTSADSVCTLRTLGFDGEPAGNIDVPESNGAFGIIPFGSKDGFLLSYSAATSNGQRSRTARVTNNALKVDYESQLDTSLHLASMESGGYWLEENTNDPNLNASGANIRYVSSSGAVGDQLVLAYGECSNPDAQNQVRGLATIGDVVGAAINTVDSNCLRTTSAFLRQGDGTIKRVDLHTFQGDNPFSYAYGMETLDDGHFVMKWTRVTGEDWNPRLTFMNTDGSGVETLEVPMHQMTSVVGQSVAMVEYDQVTLKITLRIFDTQMQPIAEPLVVAKDVKGYSTSFPDAHGNTLDSIMVAYTEQQKDASFLIKAAIIGCE